MVPIIVIVIILILLINIGLYIFLNKSSPSSSEQTLSSSEQTLSSSEQTSSSSEQTSSSSEQTSSSSEQTSSVLTTSPIVTLVMLGSRNFDQFNNIPQSLDNIKNVSIGGYHTLALKNDGTLLAWGSNTNNQGMVPNDLSTQLGNRTIKHIETGNSSSYLLLSDNTVITIDNSYISNFLPKNLNNISKLAVGKHIGLALINGVITGWGYYYMPLPDDLNKNIVDIATPKGGSGRHSLALTSSGGIIAWGSNNDANQLTIPGGTIYPNPPSNTIIYTINSGFKKVLCGEFFSIAVRQNNTAVVWGSLDNGLNSLNTSINNINIKNIVNGYEFIIIQNTNNQIFVFGDIDIDISIYEDLKTIEQITNAKSIYAGGYNAGYII
jgi:alpha-tubulin suppressor-like RCC1 family protein